MKQISPSSASSVAATTGFFDFIVAFDVDCVS
jgi:hypothetical protein